MQPDIPFGEGDQAPIFTKTLTDENNNALDLIGATVIFRYRLRSQSAPAVEEPVTIVDAAAGKVEWAPATPLAAGNYTARFIGTLASGRPISIPNDRKFWMRVDPKP